jgi:cob(I)alamin adenosyltransferase
MKIYTGTGDRGKTSLFSGERVKKSHARIELCGDIDELNSVLGALAAVLPDDRSKTVEEIQHIQSFLLQIGAWFSTTPGSPVRAEVKIINESHIRCLETAIDRMEEMLPELKDFILPGGHLSAAWAHMARAVCRRVERNAVRLFEEIEDKKAPDENKNTVVCLNRLSDYLFVLARYCNLLSGVKDIPWKP